MDYTEPCKHIRRIDRFDEYGKYWECRTCGWTHDNLRRTSPPATPKVAKSNRSQST